MSRRSRARLLPVALTLLLLLPACASSTPPQVITKLQVERLPIPPPLLQCQPDPDIPDGLMGDREIADYLVSLWEAGDDCRGKLSAIKEIAQ